MGDGLLAAGAGVPACERENGHGRHDRPRLRPRGPIKSWRLMAFGPPKSLRSCRVAASLALERQPPPRTSSRNGRAAHSLRSRSSSPGPRSLRARIDVDLGTRAGCPGLRPARTSPASSRPTVAATSGRASTAPPAYSSIAPARPAEPLRMPTLVTSLRAWVECRRGSATGPGRCARSASGLDEIEGLCRHPRLVRRVDHRVPGEVGEGVDAQASAKPRRGAKSSERAERPTRWTSAPAGRANRAASRPIVPAPETSSRSPGGRRRPRRRARRCRPARPAPRPTSSTESGSVQGAVAGTASRSARAPGKPRGCRSRGARHRRAGGRYGSAGTAAADHRVAGHPAAEPGRIDARADPLTVAAPFVADPDGVGRGPRAGRPSRR